MIHSLQHLTGFGYFGKCHNSQNPPFDKKLTLEKRSIACPIQLLMLALLMHLKHG